jgi:putative ABC transport system ATP-binding protein
MMQEEAIIQIVELSKVYGLGEVQVRALDGVSLVISKGEFVAIMGPSGSGKSTLMNILGCLDRPSDGNYILAGDDVSELDRTQLAIIRNQRIGFIFQSYNLLPQTTALDNVILPLLYNRNGNKNDEQQAEIAIAALESVGLSDRIEHKPQELSGGQMQRVAIARALVNDPVLILADEPTGNLDTRSGQEIMTLMSELHQQGSTIVMVTHDDDIAAYAQRTIRLRDGKIETDVQNGRNSTRKEAKESEHEGQ